MIRLFVYRSDCNMFSLLQSARLQRDPYFGLHWLNSQDRRASRLWGESRWCRLFWQRNRFINSSWGDQRICCTNYPRRSKYSSCSNLDRLPKRTQTKEPSHHRTGRWVLPSSKLTTSPVPKQKENSLTPWLWILKSQPRRSWKTHRPLLAWPRATLPSSRWTLSCLTGRSRPE